MTVRVRLMRYAIKREIKSVMAYQYLGQHAEQQLLTSSCLRGEVLLLWVGFKIHVVFHTVSFNVFLPLVAITTT